MRAFNQPSNHNPESNLKFALAANSGRSGAASHAAVSASARPPAGALDKRGATLTPAASERALEQVSVSRWRIKHKVANLLRDVPEGASVPGVCKCGTAGHEVDQVDLTLRAGRPGVAGVYYCDSPWVCPTCAPRRAAQRADKVNQVFDATEARGGFVVFITLTVQHRKQDALADLKALVSSACRKARQGKGWKLAVDRFGIAGVIVGPEVTWSPKHGWHFHLHVGVPMILDPETRKGFFADVEESKGLEALMEHAEAGGEWLINRYQSYIQRAGARADRKRKADRKAQDVQVCWRREDLARYLAKGTAAWEISSAGATKESKNRDGLTPWDLAVRAGQGDEKAAMLFREYAAVMPGTRSCVVSPALAAKLDLKPSDDEDAPGVEVVEDEAEVVGSMEPPRWHRLLRNGFAADVLKAVADRKPWPEIDVLISRLLHEERRKEQPKPCPPISVHAPAAWEIARQAAARAHVFRGRQGQALQVVLEEHRTMAMSKGLTFAPPPLREVWSHLAQ